MDISDLRIALFNGNYNITVDGANKALNRLVEYLQRKGARVHVYSAKVDNPAFEPQGTLVGVPAIPIPGRDEYRVPLYLNGAVKDDLAAFDPHIVHVSSPDPSAHRAVTWARKRGLPILASVHTRFETYPRYYNATWLEPLFIKGLRRFYGRTDALVAPSDSMIAELRKENMHHDIGLWTRGVDRDVFHPSKRDLQWRRDLGIADDDMAIGFLGRLVLEKGLDVFADTIVELRKRGVPAKVLVIGEGPAHDFFKSKVPDAIFAGFQNGPDLGRAVASMDVLLNPSVTETFGNVTLEAMACGVPVVAADATGASSLVTDGKTGHLVEPRDIAAYADRLQTYVRQPDLRRAHGDAGAAKAEGYEWDAINQVVADTYLRLIAAKTTG